MNVCTFSASMLLLGRQKGRPVWRGAGMVICLDLHMAQLMPLPRTVSCFCKIQIGFLKCVCESPMHVHVPSLQTSALLFHRVAYTGDGSPFP